jgi:signal transduction histidine kinase
MKLGVKLFIITVLSFIVSVLTFLAFEYWPGGYLLSRTTSPLEFNLTVFIGFLLAILLFMISFFLFVNKTIRYIQYMEKGVKKIAHENLGSTIRVQGADELSELARSINLLSVELKRKIDDERETEKLKNELITNVSHDLRTPLTTIIGFLRILKEKKYEDDQAHDEFVYTAYEKAERLKQLLDGLFEYTKLSNKEIELQLTEINLRDMLIQFVDEMEPIAEEQQLVIHSQFPAEKVTVLADPNLLLRILENLMSNALKYSIKPGQVDVKLVQDGRYALIVFGNRSSSIPQEELPRLFERLYKLDKARSADHDSSGLGLAIAKSIIDLHEGDIWAEGHGNYIELKIRLKMAA